MKFKCPHCLKNNDVKATKCAYCCSNIKYVPPTNKEKTQTTIFSIGCLSVIVFFIWLFTGPCGAKKIEYPAIPNDNDVKRAIRFLESDKGLGPLEPGGFIYLSSQKTKMYMDYSCSIWIDYLYNTRNGSPLQGSAEVEIRKNGIVELKKIHPFSKPIDLHKKMLRQKMREHNF